MKLLKSQAENTHRRKRPRSTYLRLKQNRAELAQWPIKLIHNS